jgi:hypothetical protein
MTTKCLFPKVVHHQCGQDVVFVRDVTGKRQTIYLGKHDSADAQRRYREVHEEVVARCRQRTSPPLGELRARASAARAAPRTADQSGEHHWLLMNVAMPLLVVRPKAFWPFGRLNGWTIAADCE